MRKILILVLCLAGSFVMAQNKKSCCTKPSTGNALAMFAADKSFQSVHLSPLPFTFNAEKGKIITYTTQDGKTADAFIVMADKPTYNYIFVIHEWWGLNDYIKREAEKLQKELGNVNVIALDLYDGKVATDAETAGKYMGEVKEERAKAVINGALVYVGGNAKVGTIGWCFGGGWSLQAALLGGNRTMACVMFYGLPIYDSGILKNMNSDVLGIFASKDGWINQDMVKNFEHSMKEAGKKITVKTYDADHAFANPSNPKYNKEYAADAHKLVLEYFRSHLK